MTKKTDQINPSDFFQDLALSLKSERSIGKAENIVDFITTELDQEKWGVELCREQFIPLKVFYGIDLDQEDRDILEQWKLDGKTTWEPLDTSTYQGFVLEGGRRSGKCCDINNTRIFTNKGMYKLKDFVGESKEGDFVPIDLCVSSGTKEYSHATFFYNNGTKTVSKLETSFGYELSGVPEHRVKVIDEQGNLIWRYFKDLKKGDYVALSKKPNIWSKEYYPIGVFDFNRDPIYLNEPNGYLMGLMFGNGYWDQDSIYIKGHESDLEEYKYILLGYFRDLAVAIERKGYQKKYRVLRLYGSPFEDLLESLNCHGQCETVPEAIFKSPKSVVVEFLRGLFDTTGFISKEGKGIELCSSSKDRVKEIQTLLLNLGILSRIWIKEVKEYKHEGGKLYRLRLIGSDSHRKFAEEIGFRLSRKASRLSYFRDRREDIERHITIPNQQSWCRKLRELLPKGSKSTQKYGRSYRSEYNKLLGEYLKSMGGDGISYTRIKGILRWMEETGYSEKLPEIYSHFRQFEDTNYFYDRIVGFQEYETDTGDLVVPEGHTYTANGIISHNSTVSSLIIAYEFYKLVMEPSPQAKYGISRNSPISILAIATTATQTERTIFKQVRGVIPLIKSLKRMIDQGEIFIGKKAITHEDKMVYIYPGNSESSGQVGQNVLCLVMDEVARFAVDSEGNSNAETIWSNIGLSGMTFGKDAKRIALSSAWEQGDAIEKLYNLAEDEDSFIGFRLKSWDMNPKKASRDNPVVRAEYSLNPLKAALEFEGKRLTPLNRFLDQDLIRECFRGRSKVRYVDEDSEDRLIRKRVTKVEPSDYPSIVHIDPAIVRDSYALAIGHAEKDSHGQRLVVIDCMMAWHPQPGSQVSVSNVQEAILEINKKRFIQKLTSDHHQNTETIQRLQTMGINAEGKFFGNKYQLMIYEQLRFIINEGRLILPRDSPVKDLAKDELNQLELINGTKIDHPKGGSKDLADAIASVAWHLTGDESSDDMPMVLSTYKSGQEVSDPRSLGAPRPEDSDFLKRGSARIDYFRKRKSRDAYFG